MQIAKWITWTSCLGCAVLELFDGNGTNTVILAGLSYIIINMPDR